METKSLILKYFTKFYRNNRKCHTRTPCFTTIIYGLMFNDFLSTRLVAFEVCGLQLAARHAESGLTANVGPQLEPQAIKALNYCPSVITYLWPYEVSHCNILFDLLLKKKRVACLITSILLQNFPSYLRGFLVQKHKNHTLLFCCSISVDHRQYGVRLTKLE